MPNFFCNNYWKWSKNCRIFAELYAQEYYLLMQSFWHSCLLLNMLKCPSLYGRQSLKGADNLLILLGWTDTECANPGARFSSLVRSTNKSPYLFVRPGAVTYIFRPDVGVNKPDNKLSLMIEKSVYFPLKFGSLAFKRGSNVIYK